MFLKCFSSRRFHVDLKDIKTDLGMHHFPSNSQHQDYRCFLFDPSAIQTKSVLFTVAGRLLHPNTGNPLPYLDVPGR